MTPIISPFFIYFLGIIDGLKDVLDVAGILAMIGLVVTMIGYCVSKYETCFEDSQEFWKKGLRKFILAFCIAVPLAILTPNKNTIIAMYVTKFVTTDNVTKAIEAGGNFKDVIKEDIIDVIEAMRGEKETK